MSSGVVSELPAGLVAVVGKLAQVALTRSFEVPAASRARKILISFSADSNSKIYLVLFSVARRKDSRSFLAFRLLRLSQRFFQLFLFFVFLLFRLNSHIAALGRILQ